MKRTARIFAAATALSLGALVAYVSWVRLGWRRHGRDAWDWGFLHLDWIFQPELPYWETHMLNLAGLAVGLGLVVVGVIPFFGAVNAAWRSRGE